MALRTAIAFAIGALVVLPLGSALRAVAGRGPWRWLRQSGGIVLVVALPVGIAAATAIPTRAIAVSGGAAALLAFAVARDRLRMPRWLVIAAMVAVPVAVAAVADLRLPLGGVPTPDFLWTVAWLGVVTLALAKSGNAAGQFPGLAGASVLGIVALAAFAGQSAAAGISAALLGSLVGFLAYNARPASLGIGAGATFAGFLIAAGALWVDTTTDRPGSLLVSFLLVAVPLLDALVVTLSRLRRRRPLSVRLGDHLSHRLVAAGMSPTRMILVLTAVQLACSVVAIFCGRGVLSPLVGSIVAAVLLVGLAVAAMRVQMVEEVTGFSARFRIVAYTVVGIALVASVAALATALSSRTRLIAARERAIAAIEAASEGNSARALRLFEEAERDFAAAHDRLGSILNTPALFVPVVGSNMHAASELARVGLDLSRAGRELASQISSDDLRFVDGRVPLEAVLDIAPELDDAADVLVTSRRAMYDLDTAYLVSEMRDGVVTLRRRLAGAARDASRAAAAARLAPRVLGGDGPRRYLLLVQNSAELRATGGLIGNWGILTAEDGRIRLTALERIKTLNESGNPAARTLHAPEDYLERYTRFDPARSLQNVNMSPDFPTVAEVVVDLYTQATGDSVDGVLAVDPVGLRALLELTGPVRVEGWPTQVGAGNVVDVTLRDAYAEFARTPERADFLGDVARAALDRATTGDLGSLDRMSHELSTAARQGHLVVWFSTTRDEHVVDEIGYSGTMPDPRGDILLVNNSNAGANKLDYYLERSVDYTVAVRPSGDLRKAALDATVSVRLANTAPLSGLPQIAAGPYEGATDRYVYGQNHTFLSMYTPLGYTGARVDGEAVDLEGTSELGHNVYSTFLDVFAKEANELAVDLTGTTKLRGSGWYELTLVRQPTLRADQVTVRITVPEGFQILKAPGFEIADGVAQASLNLLETKTLRVRIGRDAGANLWQRLEAGY